MPLTQLIIHPRVSFAMASSIETRLLVVPIVLSAVAQAVPVSVREEEERMRQGQSAIEANVGKEKQTSYRYQHNEYIASRG